MYTEYKAKRKAEIIECLCAVVAAILMMLPVIAIVYATMTSYEKDNLASEFVTFVFMLTCFLVTLIILRMLCKQFEKSIQDVKEAQMEFLNSNGEDKALYIGRKRKQKKLTITFAILVVIIFITVTGIRTAGVASTYEKAESLITQEKYEQAGILLETIEDKNYKDTKSLIVLCEAYTEHSAGYSVDAYHALNKVTFYYQDAEQKEKINNFKKELKEAYDAYIKRQADRAMQSYEEKKSQQSDTTKPKSTYVPKKKTTTTKDDLYDIDRHRNAEDFYDENYHYFSDYYEAEKYFNEHKE